MKKLNIISSFAALSLVVGLFSAAPAEAKNNAYNVMLNQMAMQAAVNRAQEAQAADAYQTYLWNTGHDPSLYTGVPGAVVPVNSPQAQAYNAYVSTYGAPVTACNNSYGYNTNSWNNNWVNREWRRHHHH